jgi:hypothetical protein
MARPLRIKYSGGIGPFIYSSPLPAPAAPPQHLNNIATARHWGSPIVYSSKRRGKPATFLWEPSTETSPNSTERKGCSSVPQRFMVEHMVTDKNPRCRESVEKAFSEFVQLVNNIP